MLTRKLSLALGRALSFPALAAIDSPAGKSTAVSALASKTASAS